MKTKISKFDELFADKNRQFREHLCDNLIRYLRPLDVMYLPNHDKFGEQDDLLMSVANVKVYLIYAPPTCGKSTFKRRFKNFAFILDTDDALPDLKGKTGDDVSINLFDFVIDAILGRINTRNSKKLFIVSNFPEIIGVGNAISRVLCQVITMVFVQDSSYINDKAVGYQIPADYYLQVADYIKEFKYVPICCLRKGDFISDFLQLFILP